MVSTVCIYSEYLLCLSACVSGDDNVLCHILLPFNTSSLLEDEGLDSQLV